MRTESKPIALRGYPFKAQLLLTFVHLYATPVEVHLSTSLYYNSQYIFLPNWSSLRVQVVRLKELLFCFSIVIAAGCFLSWYCSVAMHMFGFWSCRLVDFPFVRCVLVAVSTQLADLRKAV
jgi:hypothetical protein